MLTFSFIPSASVMAAFFLAAILLTLTPGPDMTLFLGKAVTRGKWGGLAAYLGASSGLVIHTTAVALGLSALLAASPTAFLALKVIGAAYLLYLAWQALRQGSALSLPEGHGEKEPLKAIYLKGFLVNILNPKIIVFFVTFLPQFVEQTDANAGGKLFFLGMSFIIIATPISIAMIWSAERIAKALKANPKALKAFDYGFAGVLTAFAVKLALAQAK